MQCWRCWAGKGMGNRLEAIARGGCRQQISRVALSIAAGDQKAFLASGINNSFSCRRQFGKAFTSFPQADAPVFLASELPGSYLNLRSGRLYHFIHQRGNIKRTMTFHAAALPAATLSGQGTQLDAHPGLAAAGGLSEAAVSDSAEVGVDMQEAQTRGEGSGGVSTSRGSGDKGAKSNPGSLRFRERIMIDRVFEELGLDKLSAQVGGIGKKIRHHVNPLRAEFQVKTLPPVWADVFADPSLPLHVDIGCAQGRFLLTLAKRSEGAANFLGLEIRSQLVDRANRWSTGLELRNAHFLVANATISLDSILSTYPGPLTYVSILCPDPHFKNRVKNRRVVQPSLVEAICEKLVPGGEVFVQSDVLEVADDMKYQLQAAGGTWLSLAGEHARRDMCTPQGWLLESPLGVPTERETFAVANGESIYRALFVRNEKEFASIQHPEKSSEIPLEVQLAEVV